MTYRHPPATYITHLTSQFQHHKINAPGNHPKLHHQPPLRSPSHIECNCCCTHCPRMSYLVETLIVAVGIVICREQASSFSPEGYARRPFTSKVQRRDVIHNQYCHVGLCSFLIRHPTELMILPMMLLRSLQTSFTKLRSSLLIIYKKWLA